MSSITPFQFEVSLGFPPSFDLLHRFPGHLQGGGATNMTSAPNIVSASASERAVRPHFIADQGHLRCLRCCSSLRIVKGPATSASDAAPPHRQHRSPGRGELGCPNICSALRWMPEDDSIGIGLRPCVWCPQRLALGDRHHRGVGHLQSDRPAGPWPSRMTCACAWMAEEQIGENAPLQHLGELLPRAQCSSSPKDQEPTSICSRVVSRMETMSKPLKSMPTGLRTTGGAI